MSNFQNDVRELGGWLDEGREVLRFVEVLWCAGEVDAAARVWTLACACAEVVVRDHDDAEAALDGVERALYGLSPLARG